MKKRAVIFFVLLLFAIPGRMLFAAPPEVSATLKPDSVLIGDRFTMEVIVRKDMMQLVGFPSFTKGELVPGIEVTEESPLDTLQTDGRMQTLRKTFTMTSFTAGIYDLERFPVLYGDKNITDTLFSGGKMRITVGEPELDTTEKSDIKEIKTPEETPLLASEISGYVIMTLLLGCILAAAIYTIRKAVLKHRRKDNGETIVEAAIPPHVRAIHDLEKLHSQKLWQSGKHKQYYTRLTDIIRYYLLGRFGLNAMEMTSEEIINELRDLPLSDTQHSGLSEILRTADLVKFAKFNPDDECNDKTYYAAYYFVENTKEIPEESTGESQNTESDEE